MTDTIESQLAEAQAEATRLREHNATLLSEKKQLAKDYAKLQETHAVATAALHRLQLDGPVEALVDEISTDAKLFNALWSEGHKFALDEQGRPCVQTAEGKPVMVKDKDGNETPLAFEASAIAAYLCPTNPKERGPETERWARVLVGSRASGGGATGGSTRGGVTERAAPTPQPQPSMQFGLR